MKVLQIINSLATGGAEKLILESVPLFNTKDITMDVAVLNGENHPFFKALKDTHCCNIHSLSKLSVYNPVLIFKIIPYLKQYDLIHVHLFPSLYWVALAKMMSFSKTKLIYTEHSTSNTRRKHIIFRSIDKVIYSFYSKIITISKEVDENIKLHLGYKNDCFELINNGINLEAINQVKPIAITDVLPPLREPSKVLIQVASFRYPKDQKTIIKALKLLPENIILVLVGDGPLKQDCEILTESLNLTHRVFFLGIRMEVIGLLKASDIVILSSHHEGLSLSCIEGMASGKPFMATDAPGLGEIVKGAGILFPINDSETLALEINKLLKNKPYYNTIVAQCMERATWYSINNTINKQLSLYKSLI